MGRRIITFLNQLLINIFEITNIYAIMHMRDERMPTKNKRYQKRPFIKDVGSNVEKRKNDILRKGTK